MIGHAAPEAAVGGNIGLVQDGDTIRMNVETRELNMLVSDEELERRRRVHGRRPPLGMKRGVMAKYALLVGSASQGAVTS